MHDPIPPSQPRTRRSGLLGAAASSLLLAACAGGMGGMGSGSSSAAPTGGLPKVAVGIDQCVPAALAQQPGEALQVVLKREGGQPVWEIEIEGQDGRLYDIECSGADGRIVETERRFRSGSEPGFQELARVSEAEAQKTALAKYPGTVERVEYELEADGAPVYEFDIQMAGGQDMRVEVNAVTGALHEGHAELVEVGRLPGR